MKPQLPAAALAALLLVLAPAAGAQDAGAAGRGRLLYENHCSACHGAQMHWRDKREASDWNSLRAQVRRWQASAHLAWTEDEITDVARHLNDTYYRFDAAPGRSAPAPATGVDLLR